MKLDNKKGLVLIMLVASILLLFYTIFVTSYSYGPNYENVSVDSRVNITNAPPRVLSVTVDEGVNGNTNLTLLAGLTRIIYCNATIRDWNGFNDLNRTNATFWDNTNANKNDALDNNKLYRNTSCTMDGNDGEYLSYWRCSMEVYYYANNGSNWKCNITTVDDADFKASNDTTTTISSLYALNMSATNINFGNVPVEGTSTNKTIDVINFGNMAINVSVWGYARVGGDNIAMNCTINGNISIGSERFSTDPAVAWAAKTALSATPQDIGLTVVKQTVAGTPISNTTYWQLYVPPMNTPAGICTGTVVFEATAG